MPTDSLTRSELSEVLAREVARRVTGQARLYVVRISDPMTARERLQLAAARLQRSPVAIMPHRCATADEWFARYADRGG
jgi:hypothetical protein